MLMPGGFEEIHSSLAQSKEFSHMKDNGSQHSDLTISSRGRRKDRSRSKFKAMMTSIIKDWLAHPEKYRTRYTCVVGYPDSQEQA